MRFLKRNCLKYTKQCQNGIKKKCHISHLRPLFFENLFNEPADSSFPKIRIKIKIGFQVFLFAPIRNSSPHFILCDAFANGGQWTW